MKELPEDGCLGEFTATTLNPANIIIIRRSEDLKEPGETTYTFATCDRTKEGVEWPGDKYLEKLIPELPKVKVPEMSKPEEITETNIQYRRNARSKYYQKPVQRNSYFASRRSRQAYKSYSQKRSEKPQDIDPWVHKPWENSIFQGMNTATSVNTPLNSNAPFNNSCIQNVPPSHTFAPSTNSNNYNFLNNNEINMIPAAPSNSQFLNNHMEVLNMPAVRVPNGLFPQPPDRFFNQHQIHPSERFSAPGPTPNMNINHTNHETGLFSEIPIARYNAKQGLLGDAPLSNMPFNRNSTTFPNNISAQSDPEGNTATLHSSDQKMTDKQNNSMSNGLYDTDYGRIPRHNFHQYDGNKIYRNKSDNFCEFPSKNSRGNYRKNFRFKKRPARSNHSKTGYAEKGNNKHKNDYNEKQLNKVSKASFRNNQTRNLAEDSLIHISNSAVVYNPEDFQNNEYSEIATNSAPTSNVNSMLRSNIRRNSQTKNNRWPRQHWTANNRQNRVKYNQGQQKFRN